MMKRSWLLGAAAALAVAGVPALAASQSLAATAHRHQPRALLVCNGSTTSCPGRVKHFKTVQAAVDAARTGDWVLIWPGVYHEKSKSWPTAGVWVQKPGIHIR